MSENLKKFLIRSYPVDRDSLVHRSWQFIQIDDQDDNDNIQTFCNIFITFLNSNTFQLELSGKFPITPAISDICEIYKGYANVHRKTVTLMLDKDKVDVIDHLVEMLKETSHLGNTVDNAEWEQMSARTISSLKRLSRTIREYVSEVNKSL